MTEELIPVGHWIQIEIPEQGTFVGYTVLDARSGFFAHGCILEADKKPTELATYVRLQTPNIPWQPMPEAEVERLGLPLRLDWIEETFGPQPPYGMLWGWWRDHPDLRAHFHPESADDLPVMVHDGGPRFSQHPPERVWVRVIGGEDDVFTGQVLNQPHNLQSISLGSRIQFIAPRDYEHLLMVTPKYLQERPYWNITPCQKCGLPELFDAPSDLIKVVFPDLPAGSTMESFTSFCGVCRGIQVVERKQE